MDVRKTLVVATPLEDDLVERIRARAGDWIVTYDRSLVPPPLYRGDHRGDPAFERDAAQTERWRAILAKADVVLGFPGESPAGVRALMDAAPNVRWVQSMYAGAGETLRAANLSRDELERVAFTTTSGVHATMLAEFAFFGILALRKDARRLEALRAERSWQRFPVGELAGSTLTVAGVGNIGTAVARIGRAFGMRTIGVARDGGSQPDASAFDEVVTFDRLVDACARTDVLALALPGTAATNKMVGAREFEALRNDAIVVNVGRGTTLDQTALIHALRAGRLAGAVLDVFDPEPLPPNDPLWTMENVVFAPHTATLSIHENARIVDLFLDNLDRFERAEPLRNRVDVEQFY